MNKQSGQSVFEVLIAIGVFAISAMAAFQVFFGGQKLTIDSQNYNLATDYGREGVEALQNIRARNWNELTNGAHGLVFQNNQWMFGSSSTSDTKDVFTRTISIGTIDSNTKAATTTITWQADPLHPQVVEQVQYLTKWSSPVSGGCSSGTLSGNWASPHVVGSGDIGAGNSGTDVVVKFPYAIESGTASSASKPDIFVFDVSNSASPTLVKSLDVNSTGINALYLKGNYVYAASSDDAKEMQVFDVTNPASISLVGTLNLSGTKNAISISGKGSVVYVGREEDDAAGELSVIDVSNPAAPALITSIEVGDNVTDAWATSDRLYLSSDESSQKLWIYDISTPSAPAFLTSYNVGANAASVSVHLPADVLMGDTSNNLFSVGATNTSQIYKRSTLVVGGAVNDIACVGDSFAFLATANSTKEFFIANIANLDNLTEYASLNLPQVGTGIDFAGNTIYMSLRSNDSLKIITSQ